ncbi:MAG: amidohydrolase family protein [Devosia sp.]
MMKNYDLVIRGGTVLDGRGGSAFKGDVAIKDGLIAKVGSVPERGVEEIDASGKLVTPGFVDVHTHYDGQATWDRFLTPSSLHGVTTVVMGNCGVGFAPVRQTDHAVLIDLMEGVEDIPGTALHEGLKWNWSSFPEYLDALEAIQHDIDLCAQVPHGALRLFVMGDRALRYESATDADIEAMRRLVAEAITAGAFGVTTSRTMVHRSASGGLTPSIAAGEQELIGLALGIRDAGFGVFEAITDYQQDRADDFLIFQRVVERTRVTCSISLMQDGAQPNRWRQTLEQLEKAQALGLPMKGQVAPRAVGLIMTIESSVSPFEECPSYKDLKTLPLEEKLKTLRDPSFRQRLLSEAEALEGDPNVVRRSTFARHFSMMFSLGSELNYAPPERSSVAAIAAARGISPYAYVYDLFAGGDGTDALYVPIFNYVDGNYDACREMLASSATVPGLGDAGAHVGTICDASFTTYLLSYWGRDREAGRFELGWLIKRLTADTAALMGLTDRGILAPGLKADINVIDFDRLSIGKPHMVADLPAGGRRFMQGATGYDATIVSGTIIRRFDQATGATPGRLVRNGRSAPLHA